MRKKIAISSAVLLFVSSLSMAQVLVVNIFEPMPGKGPSTVELAQEARGIHQRLGAEPSIGLDQMNRVHYAMAFDNWTEYAELQTKMQRDKAWGAFLEKIGAEPTATQWENYMMNVMVPGEDGSVVDVFIWEPMPGKFNALLEAGRQAKAIHEKPGGVSVSINADRLNRLHYVMSYTSLETWAKYADTPNPEFQEFLARFEADPPGKLVRTHLVRRVD